jgi:flagellar biosynthesis GTPase FlhF
MTALVTHTYRGSSLEELLPTIREELGPDAVIVRRREGIIGGVAGFFGKKCIEVEAVPAVSRAALPRRAVVDAYDTGNPDVGVPVESPLVEALMAQTLPFSARLTEAIEAQEEVETEAGPEAPAPEDRTAVLCDLAAAAVPPALAEQIVVEVEQALRPFEPQASFRKLARRALAPRIPVARSPTSRRRTIAVIGIPGSGRTLAAATFCGAYASTGLVVGALSLESPRSAMSFAELTESLGVELAIADAPDLVGRGKASLRSCDVVVVDTPPIANRFDGAALRKTTALLEALRPTETHLLLPVDADPALAQRFLKTLADRLRSPRLLLTHAGVRIPNGVPVGLSLSTRTPISFVSCGVGIRRRLAPAEPDALARMVLP